MAGLPTDTARQHLLNRDKALRAFLCAQARAVREIVPHEGSDLEDELNAGLKDQSTNPPGPCDGHAFEERSAHCFRVSFLAKDRWP